MVQGLADLERRWSRIPTRMKAEVEAAMEKTAEEIVRDMRRLVPKGRTRKLVNSIGWTWGETPPGSITVAQSSKGVAYGARVLTIYAGNEEAFYARFVEFGTAPGVKGQRAASSGRKQSMSGRLVLRTHPGAPANPFFFPAWRIWRRRVRGRIAAAVRRAIAAG